MQKEWIVSLPDRLDTFLAKELPSLSRTKIQKAIAEGKVHVNDTIETKPAQRLNEGDKIVLLLPEELRPEEIKALDLSLHVLYEDSTCIVLDKPGGLAVQRAPSMSEEEVTLLSGIAFLFKDRNLPFSEESVLVHRLDRETTGCLLIAKNPEAHILLQAEFEKREVVKSYLAIVSGTPKIKEAVIDSPIGRSAANRTKMGTTNVGTTKEAQTHYRVLATKSDVALLACKPITGRTHQVRVHLSSIGHPILGDSTYTSTLSERLTQEFEIHSLCLHAWKLHFRSPADNAFHDTAAPLPLHFANALRRIGIVFSL